MLHGRDSYNERIQDSEDLIPVDEPVFLIRGQDKVAPRVLRFYASCAHAAGCSSDLIKTVMQQASDMETWQKEHGGKFADLPGEEPVKE